MAKKLTLNDYCDAARLLGCSVAAIKAVAKVESGGRGGFDERGRVLIRFEGHKFRGYTNGRYDHSHPNISYRYSQMRSKPHGYSAFNEAFMLNPTAAMLSTSWGMFQPMGFNYDSLGYGTVNEMIDDFKRGEREQLFAFCRLIQSWGLADELQRAQLADFARFARRYNGPDYRSNRYDEKMYRFYRQYRQQNIKCPDRDRDIDEAFSRIVSPAANPSREIPSVTPESDPADIRTGSSGIDAGDDPVTVPDGFDEVEVEVRRETPEGSVTVEAAKAKEFTAYIPQIDTAKRWLKWLGGFTLLGNVGAWNFAAVPYEVKVALVILVLILVAGSIWIFVRYHDQVFAYVEAMNRKKEGDPVIEGAPPD